MKLFLFALVVAILLGWLVAQADSSEREEPKVLCISAIGPVDQDGRGDTTPDVTGPGCP